MPPIKECDAVGVFLDLAIVAKTALCLKRFDGLEKNLSTMCSFSRFEDSLRAILSHACRAVVGARQLRLSGHTAVWIGICVFSCGLLLTTIANEAAAANEAKSVDGAVVSSESPAKPSSTATSQGLAAESAGTGVTPSHEGVPQSAAEIGTLFGLPISNSMVVTWVVAILIIVFAQLATSDMQLIPSGLQNFCEWLVESLRDLLKDLLGEHLVDRTFWFFATTFIFILAANWCGLIPGMGTIGWGHEAHGHLTIDRPIFRAPNADLNMTLAMAMVFFACWFYWAISEHGFIGFLKERFGPKGQSRGFMQLVMVLIFFAVGCLEIISILFRPVSLSFRLYGNIFAGDNILEFMGGAVPKLGWLLPIPFYFMELLVGFVQALVFMMLCAVFVLLDCTVETKEE